jgi:hypothetical protein
VKTAKKIISCFLLFIFSFQSIALAQTDYEKKLEYRRKKIEVLVRTTYVGETSGYTSLNASDYRWTITPEGYSYGSSQIYGTNTGRSTTRQVSDWVIVRGGIRELSDIEFLEIIGDKEKADQIQKAMDEKNGMGMWALGCGILGVASIVGAAGYATVNSSQVAVGTALILGGIFLGYLYAPQRHYIPADQAQEGADNYNIKLKKALGLPVETE